MLPLKGKPESGVGRGTERYEPADTFNLSEKKLYECEGYPEKDVKEFIKRENHLLNLYFINEIDWKTLLDRRNKLAGDELVK